MKIRTATQEDADGIRGVCLSAFSLEERELVARLATDLLWEKVSPSVLSLVAEEGGIVVGHVAFSPVMKSGTMDLLGYILAPLAVSPVYQKKGIGSGLIRSGIERLLERGPGILLVYGDPMFYGRFGFTADAAECFTPPCQLQYPFGWQGMALGNRKAGASPVVISCVSSLGNPALW